MAIVIDTTRAAGKIHVVDRKREKTTVLLVCGDDPGGAVKEEAKSPLVVWPLGLFSRGDQLRLDVTAMPPGSQAFTMPVFVDQASRFLSEQQRKVPLTPRDAAEWGWRPSSTEPPPASAGAVSA